MSVVETGIASAGGSILAYSLLACWRHHRDKTRVYPALMPLGKTYAHETLVEDQRVIFVDIDAELNVDKNLPLSKKMMEIYPKARELMKRLKKDFRNRVIVLCSADVELLRFLELKKHIKAWLPTQKFMTDNDLKERRNSVERMRMEAEIAIIRKDRKYYSSFDELSKNITEYYASKC